MCVYLTATAAKKWGKIFKQDPGCPFFFHFFGKNQKLKTQSARAQSSRLNEETRFVVGNISNVGSQGSEWKKSGLNRCYRRRRAVERCCQQRLIGQTSGACRHCKSFSGYFRGNKAKLFFTEFERGCFLVFSRSFQLQGLERDCAAADNEPIIISQSQFVLIRALNRVCRL